ncbi:MAG: CDP-alcohol phosphatidyltransferase family protein [Candidatus Xenobiia bacterium LiM19]
MPSLRYNVPVKTINNSYLRHIEFLVMEKLKKCVPSFIGTKILTYLGLLCSLLMLLCYMMAAGNRLYLLLASFFIIGEWIFDCLDGVVGRDRKEGYVRWGYYMDHFFDYLFGAAICLGFYLYHPWPATELFVFLIFISAHMVNAFLYHDALGGKEGLLVTFLSFSPIEFRLSVILFNTALFLFPDFTDIIFCIVIRAANILMALGLVIIMYFNQKRLSRLDESERDSEREAGKITQPPED